MTTPATALLKDPQRRKRSLVIIELPGRTRTLGTTGDLSLAPYPSAVFCFGYVCCLIEAAIFSIVVFVTQGPVSLPGCMTLSRRKCYDAAKKTHAHVEGDNTIQRPTHGNTNKLQKPTLQLKVTTPFNGSRTGTPTNCNGEVEQLALIGGGASRFVKME